MDRPTGTPPPWAKRFFAATLFVDDLARERQWYVDVFEMPIVDESPESCTFQFPGEVYVNLNTLAGAAHHIEPSPLPKAGMPSRAMLSVQVDDVDAVLARLASVGVQPINGPTDQPWGSRGATIADASSNYWELFSR
jgi:uncharacterized glyoxalase superfamily protein PhnB